MSKLHILTIGSDYNLLRWLLTSAQDTGIEIKSSIPKQWRGYIDKILYMKELIENIPDNDIVCFVDAYDVLAFGSTDEIIMKFQEYSCDLLISSELNLYPERYKSKYDDLYSITNSVPTTKYMFVNSGGYIGRCHALKTMFNWKTEEEIRTICADGGDQNYFTEYFLSHSSSHIKIDINQKIFQSMYKVNLNEFEFVQGRLHNKILNCNPCFAHFNGYNMYNMQIKDIYTNETGDLRDIFLALREKSITDSSYRSIDINYQVPYFIWYNGEVQGNLSQL
jgi:hypothetical protein